VDPIYDFEIVGELSNREIIAGNSAIDIIAIVRQQYGGRRWRQLKGFATVRLEDGSLSEAEVHWYECAGIGRRRMKIKRLFA
jgi:hypothetical protein